MLKKDIDLFFGVVRKKSIGMSPFAKLRSLFSDGDEAFRQIDIEKGIFCSFLTYLVVVLATTSFTLILRLIIYYFSDLQMLWQEFTNTVLSNVVALLLVPFVITLIVHPLIFLLGGRGIAGTFKVIVYALVPYLILSLIPIVGQLSFALTLFIAGYGFMKIHGLTQFKAGLAVAIPFLVAYLAMNFVGLWLALNFGLGV
jgi:hypothetical protein